MTNIFGQKLRELRRFASISQRELANQINVDFSYVSKLENGRLPPPAADTIVKISQVLGIESEELLALTGKIPSKIQESISNSKAAQQFMSEAQRLNLSDEEWKKLVKSMKNLRGTK